MVAPNVESKYTKAAKVLVTKVYKVLRKEGKLKLVKQIIKISKASTK